MAADSKVRRAERALGTLLYVFSMLVAVAYMVGRFAGAPWAGWPETRDAVLFLLVADALHRLDKVEEAEDTRNL